MVGMDGASECVTFIPIIIIILFYGFPCLGAFAERGRERDTSVCRGMNCGWMSKGVRNHVVKPPVGEIIIQGLSVGSESSV